MRARLAIGALLLLAGACRSERAEPVAKKDVAASGELTALAPSSTARLASVEQGEIGTRLTAAGSVHAHRTTPLGAGVPGRIVVVHVEVGDRVGEGEPLFQIDPAPYEIGLQSARAGRELARAELSEAREQLARSQALADRKMLAAQQLERARTAAAVAEARLRQAEAQQARAEEDLARTLVRAPFAGSIVERREHEGAMATVAPGAAVIVLQESDVLIANVDIPETSAAVVRVGDPARLFVEGLSRPLEGRVAAVSDRIDAATRTYGVRIPVLDPERRVKAGAFVRAEISPTPKTGAVVVPREAVSRREGRDFVFRVREGVAERVPVRLGVVSDDRVEVLEGLAPGDVVVVGPEIERLQDGERVVGAGASGPA